MKTPEQTVKELQDTVDLIERKVKFAFVQPPYNSIYLKELLAKAERIIVEIKILNNI